jgi:hypothetical protein
MYVHVYTNGFSCGQNAYTYKNWVNLPARCENFQADKYEADKMNLCGELVKWPVAMMGIFLGPFSLPPSLVLYPSFPEEHVFFQYPQLRILC